MPEFTLSIETPEETTSDEDVWPRVEETMRTSPNVSGARTVFHRDNGVISSRFQVEADTLEDAQTIGIRVFVDALWLAGLNGEGLWRIVEADQVAEWPRSGP